MYAIQTFSRDMYTPSRLLREAYIHLPDMKRSVEIPSQTMERVAKKPKAAKGEAVSVWTVST
jgi:hypothetical protein